MSTPYEPRGLPQARQSNSFCPPLRISGPLSPVIGERPHYLGAPCASEPAPPSTYISQDSADRKNIPIAAGVLDYFPAALAYVARISKAGNDKHNPGQELHHARGKSMDHADCIARHLIDRGAFDPEDGLRHSGKLVWRALALLQEELEREEGATRARAAR